MRVHAGPDGKLPRAFVPFRAVRAIYAGAAKSEKLEYLWLRHKKGEEVLIPRVNKFGDYHLKHQKQMSHDLPADSAMKGVLLPEQTGKDGQPYRLLKVQTRPATPQEEELVGNDRMPVVIPWPEAPDFEQLPPNPKREQKSARAAKAAKEENARSERNGGQMELF